MADQDRLDLSRPRRLHIVGAGGSGMSAIALVLARLGHRVTGSDELISEATRRLALEGVDVSVPNDPEHVPADADAVIASTAVPAANVELRRARELGIPVLPRRAALAAIVARRRSVAVAGTHGKTTTSAMLTVILRAAGLDPTYLLGGVVPGLDGNAGYGAGEWLVVEADESDGTFLDLAPEMAVVTNVEPDHLGHYGSFGALADAFRRFVEEVRGAVVLGADDPALAGISRAGAVTFGFDRASSYRIEEYEGARFGSRIRLGHAGRSLGEVELRIGGRHNALNAAAAAAAALEIGVDFVTVAGALAAFGGVRRRFEPRGEVGGVCLVDDYAHLPGEVAAAIAAAREGGWRRVVVVFQPHRYTRIGALWRDFADAFVGADHLVVTDVYGKGEDPVPGVTGHLIVRAVLDRHPSQPLSYLPTLADLLDVPRRLAGPGDVILTLGAGDIHTLPDEWRSSAA